MVSAKTGQPWRPACCCPSKRRTVVYIPLALGRRVGLVFLDQRQDPCAGIALVHKRLLGTEVLELIEDTIGAVGDLLDQLPLGGVGQLHAH